MSNWLDYPNTSNRFIQIYVRGFVDISGGKLILRNDDASFNRKLFVGNDTSLNNDLFVKGNAYIDSKLVVNNDTIINNRLFTNGDVLFSSNLSIHGNILIKGRSNATSFETESDYRIKSNVQPLVDTSFTVDLLKPVTYINKKLNKQDIGFIAHEYFCKFRR